MAALLSLDRCLMKSPRLTLIVGEISKRLGRYDAFPASHRKTEIDISRENLLIEFLKTSHLSPVYLMQSILGHVLELPRHLQCS